MINGRSGVSAVNHRTTGGNGLKVSRDMIDPQLRLTGRILDLVMGGNRSVELVRKRVESPGLWMRILERAISKPKDVQLEERWIPRADGSLLRIVVMKPLKQPKDVPGLLGIHGGGYFMGKPEGSLLFPKYVAAVDCVVVAPDYRLSVEAPYPAALEDCYTALVWLKENADSLGVRDDQLVVTGESAGGGLTAAITMYARDRGEINIAFQMPIYPMIDDRNDTESAKDNDGPVWDSVTNEVGWKLYLGDLWGTEDVPPYAAPARATNYGGLPPTYTFVGGLEPFRDETITYIENLKAAGIPADIDVYEGCFHGFDVAWNADVSKRAHRRLIEWFGYAVREYRAPQRGAGSDRPTSSSRDRIA